MISWAHRDPGWDDAQAERWANEVLTLAIALRSLGIDAEVDLFHRHERGIDWSRWGPLQTRERDVVLLAVSQGWRERWEGTNNSRMGAGAVAEADALLGIFNSDGQQAFREKVIVIVLPSMRAQAVIPDRLTGVNRVELDDFSEASLKPLLHLLLEIPLHERPRLGALPDLTPVPRQPSTDSPEEDLEMLEARIQVLRTTAAALAATSRGGPQGRPHEQISLRVDAQLAELLRQRTTHLRGERPSRLRSKRRGLLATLVLVSITGVLAGIALGAVTYGAGKGDRAGLAHSTTGPAVSIQPLPRSLVNVSLPELHRKHKSYEGAGQSHEGTGVTASTATSEAPAPPTTSAPMRRAAPQRKASGGNELHSESGGGA
jgi:hypothetical protein